MEKFAGFILSIITVALIVGILGNLMPKGGSMGRLYRLVSGLFLAFTIVLPVVDLDFSGLDTYFREFALDGEYHSARGKQDADQMYRALIKAETEAYIVDKAGSFQAEMKADVKLSEEDHPVPVSVLLKGNISPYAKKRLADLLENELGISKENQKWAG